MNPPFVHCRQQVRCRARGSRNRTRPPGDAADAGDHGVPQCAPQRAVVSSPRRRGSLRRARRCSSAPRCCRAAGVSGSGRWLRVGVQVSASASEVSRAIPTVRARERKNTPVTPVIEISGRNTTIGVSVDPTSGTVISRRALRTASRAALARIPVHDDVLDDHDGVVDDEPDRGREPPQRHEVEALAHDAQRNEGQSDRGRNHQPGHQRRAPVAKEQYQNQRSQARARPEWRRGRF